MKVPRSFLRVYKYNSSNNDLASVYISEKIKNV